MSDNSQIISQIDIKSQRRMAPSRSLNDIQQILLDNEQMATGKVVLLGGELSMICAYLMNMDCKRSDSIKALKAELEKKDDKIKSLDNKIHEMETMKLNLADLIGDTENEGKLKMLDDDCGRNAFRMKELEEGSVKNEVRLKDLEEQICKREDRLWKLEDSIKDATKEGIGKQIAEVKEKVEKFASVEVAVNNALKKQESESLMRSFHMELDMVAPNLIFRNFPQEEGEDRASLKMAVQDVFQTIGIGPRIVVKEAIRFKKKEEGGDRRGSWAEETGRRPGLVLVKLSNPDMKKIIFSNIRKLQGTPYSRISINNQYPKCVVPQVTALEIKARKIRVDSGFKTKTKIELNSGKPKIQVKEENDRDFKDIEIPRYQRD